MSDEYRESHSNPNDDSSPSATPYEDQDFLERTKNAADSAQTDPESPNPWDSDEAFESLTMERTIHTDETAAQMTKRLLEDAAPMAAASIVHIALHSANDNTRLNAARYITDKVYEGTSAGAEAWEELVADVVDTAEVLANQPQKPRSS